MASPYAYPGKKRKKSAKKEFGVAWMLGGGNVARGARGPMAEFVGVAQWRSGCRGGEH